MKRYGALLIAVLTVFSLAFSVETEKKIYIAHHINPHPPTIDGRFDDPNFNFLQSRSNLVIRWEYRPGSVLFLFWSQGRTDVLSHGDFSFGNDMCCLFDIHPHNVFLVKLSYSFRL